VAPLWPERVFDAGNHAQIADALAQLYRADKSGDAERRRVASYAINTTVDTVAALYGGAA
jgi:hypothetical protein